MDKGKRSLQGNHLRRAHRAVVALGITTVAGRTEDRCWRECKTTLPIGKRDSLCIWWLRRTNCHPTLSARFVLSLCHHLSHSALWSERAFAVYLPGIQRHQLHHGVWIQREPDLQPSERLWLRALQLLFLSERCQCRLDELEQYAGVNRARGGTGMGVERRNAAGCQDSEGHWHDVALWHGRLQTLNRADGRVCATGDGYWGSRDNH